MIFAAVSFYCRRKNVNIQALQGSFARNNMRTFVVWRVRDNRAQKGFWLLGAFRALLLLALLCVLPACAKEPVLEAVYVGKSLPLVLTQPVEKPVLRGDTNGDLADYALSLEHALNLCNAKLVKSRELQP